MPTVYVSNNTRTAIRERCVRLERVWSDGPDDTVHVKERDGLYTMMTQDALIDLYKRGVERVWPHLEEESKVRLRDDPQTEVHV